MSHVCRDLRLYLRLLHLMGMMCWRFDPEHCQLLDSPGLDRYALVYAAFVLVASTGCFAFAHLQPHRFHIAIYNRTGNVYETVIFRSTCLVLVLLYVLLYVRRHRHRSLVQHLLRLNRRCVDSSTDRQFLHNLLLYGVLTAVCCGNYFHGYSRAGLAALPLALCLVVYTYAYSVLCLLLVFFVCLKQVMAAGLTHFNQQLGQGALLPALRGRQQIVEVCGGELNACFGPLMLPIVALVLLMAPAGPFYLISTVLEGKFGPHGGLAMLLTSSIWDAPWMVMLVLMLRTNGIAVEANKTAKILAKVPRTGTGLDRMIDKFLLKNLRQQPILTAFGFFALDKSTLFKLFTAIFTYMVILVQFKEMENSTKAIGKV
ncbi:gustatory and pheromone receptor 39a-like isoform X2 [Drosophila ficusphila]|uniref:gustatory and pheromone receptor 39a-like isoform X2 n=1 Tax=Drosophila ficusphila TaxID=30025 RepID=UPI0007E76900|nr:gustatory and pheromone receptor 39a-like isoform X2 [Drosophila ficusphila]